MLTVGVPSGIGDVSWIYSKLKHVGPLHWRIAEGWPHRTREFLELLDDVESSDYGDFQYSDIATCWSLNKKDTWKELEEQRYDRLLIECNTHLERGDRLENWLPDLPCDFHYNIHTSDIDKKRAADLLEGLERPIWGISAASYRGSEAWKTWKYEEWSEFLKTFHMHAGGTILLLGGFWDDLTATLSAEGYKDLVGKTSIGTAVEILRVLDGYIGFSSGLGIIRTVLNKPTIMLWPDHQQPLSMSWAPLDMLETGTYVARPWVPPEDVFKAAKLWHKRIMA